MTNIYRFILSLKNVKKMSKLYPSGSKTKTKFFCENENISFYFLGTKIKICYIYKDEKLI